MTFNAKLDAMAGKLPAPKQERAGTTGQWKDPTDALIRTYMTTSTYIISMEKCGRYFCTHHISERRTLWECHSQNVFGSFEDSVYTARES
jgi:hypothetical protein